MYTVAVGTDGGTVQLPDGTSQNVPVNRPALADLASKTGARSFTAYSSDELRSVYKDLGRTLTKEPVQKDVSGWFVGGAMAFLALAALGSLIWFAQTAVIRRHPRRLRSLAPTRFDGLRPARLLVDRPAEPDRSTAGAPAEPLPPHPRRALRRGVTAVFMADLAVLRAVASAMNARGRAARGAR